MARRTIFASLAALLLIGAPAMADEVSIDAPIKAGSLHEGRLDMVAYYETDGDQLKLTATFLDKDGGDPFRIVMGLADKDAVAFSMPGYPGWLYSFARDAGMVRISGKPVRAPSDVAAN